MTGGTACCQKNAIEGRSKDAPARNVGYDFNCCTNNRQSARIGNTVDYFSIPIVTAVNIGGGDATFMNL